MTGPIYLLPCLAFRARSTEPAGQHEKTTSPGEAAPEGNNRPGSGIVAVQCKRTSGRLERFGDASSSKDGRRRSGGV